MNFADDIFVIERRVQVQPRKRSIEVLDERLIDGWNCEGYTGDYCLWSDDDHGNVMVFDTMAEIRGYCETMGLVK